MVIYMNDREIKWLWLTNLPGMNSAKITSLLDKFDGIEEIYNAGPEDLSGIELIRQIDIKSLSDKELKKAYSIYNMTQAANGRIVTFESEEYPESLKILPNPPYVLYVKGTLRLNSNMVTIGVVGMRECDKYGVAVTQNISFALARAGFTVVSGMARGVDSTAASAALKAGNDTIAVLGCGIDVVYPPENGKLMRAICENGAVVSEYPPLSQALRTHFPERNRIIAALSDSILVTQAPEKSGALITARRATELGKTIFAVPGSIYKFKNKGTNNLIKQGAAAVTNASDIIGLYRNELENIEIKLKHTDIEYKPVYYDNETKAPKPDFDKEKLSKLPSEERIIAEIVAEAEKISADEIIRKSEISPSRVNALLTFLELKRIIKKLAGNFYEIVSE